MKILLILCITVSTACFSQVAVGKSSVTNSNVSLEFGNSENRGLILPWVTSENDIINPVDGTVIFDTSDTKVKYLAAGAWIGLNADPNLVTPVTIDTSLQDTKTENTNAMVRIGTNVDPDVDGILVLSDTNKAMVLPKVASPHLNVVNPAPGMIVYDTTSRLVAVFTGDALEFWGPR